MRRLVTITAIAAVVATTVTPALAADLRPQDRSYVHAEPYRPIHRGFAVDPSFGNRAGINYAKQTTRCVADLGYGRFEYCGCPALFVSQPALFLSQDDFKFGR